MAYVLPDTLFWNSTEIRGLTGVRIVGNMTCLLAPGVRRGNDITIPGRSGSIAVADLPFAAYEFRLPIQVVPETSSGTLAATFALQRVQTMVNLRAIGTALGGTGVGTLTRRVASTAGPGYDAHTASGRFVDGLQFEMFNPLNGRTELQFLNLDGCWYSGSTVIVP